jgi:hypothetical protein
MLNLQGAIDRDVVAKVRGVSKAISCRLLQIEPAGIWLASKELTDNIQSDNNQVVFPAGYPRVFVPYASLEFLVHSVEQ